MGWGGHLGENKPGKWVEGIPKGECRERGAQCWGSSHLG